MPEEEHQCLAIHLEARGRVCAKRLQFGSKERDSATPPIVQGLFPEAVTAERKRRRLAVPRCESEHSHRFLQCRLNAPYIETGQDCLRIRVTLPVGRASGLLKLTAQGLMIVDLAVVNDDPPSSRRCHWLMACDREIQDRQTAVR